jgi:hypothetical protein
MVVTLQEGLYPDFVGRRMIFAGDGTGPASYVAGGDPVTLANPRLYIDYLSSGSLSNGAGTYYVQAIKSGTGSRQTWKYKWYTTSNATEVTAATNLSAASVPVGGFCGQF